MRGDRLTEGEVVARLKVAIGREGGAAFARRSGASPSNISSFMNQGTPPSERMLAAVGIRRVTVYESLR